MTPLRYDPRLIESAVFESTRRAAQDGNPQPQKELRRRLDPLYATTTNAEERERSFRDAYADLFAKARLADPLEALVAEQPLIASRVVRCFVRFALRVKNEGAELFVKPGDAEHERTLVIAVRTETLLDEGYLARLLRHELQHVADMLDDQFAYDVDGAPNGESRAHNSLILDRFRVLWDTYIDGRLARHGRDGQATCADRAREFHKVFGRDQPDPQDVDRACARIWRADGLTQADLLQWAAQPDRLLGHSSDLSTVSS